MAQEQYDPIHRMPNLAPFVEMSQAEVDEFQERYPRFQIWKDGRVLVVGNENTGNGFMIAKRQGDLFTIIGKPANFEMLAGECNPSKELLFTILGRFYQ